MYRVHGYLSSSTRGIRRVLNRRLPHIPNVGDTVRLEEGFARVLEVIWCMDEQDDEGQRINIRMEAMLPKDLGAEEEVPLTPLPPIAFE